VLKTFSRTDIGRKRKLNQDYIYTSEEPVGNLSNIFIVADGMGGHAAGDYASKEAVSTMIEQLGTSLEKNPLVMMQKAIESANAKIHRKANEDPKLEGMGTTVVAATFVGNYLEVVNVGDSRLYVIGEHSIRQITNDHSLVAEMVRRGGLKPEEARNHPDKNIITRAVGVKPEVSADTFTVELHDGDTVLMCTDGLSNMLEDETIRRIVYSSRDVAEATIRLVDEANEAGGKDNISVVLIRYEE
jgi:protein phosphatase